MSLLQARQLCADLIQHNFAESGLRGFPLVLNDAVYEALDAVGLSFSLVAFDGERPVGLCSVFISVHPQTTGLFATNDTIFCMQVYRSRGVGGRLIVLAEREAKQRGCIAFQWQSAVGSSLATALAKRHSDSYPVPLITFIRRL